MSRKSRIRCSISACSRMCACGVPASPRGSLTRSFCSGTLINLVAYTLYSYMHVFHCCVYVFRYKCLTAKTWPNPRHGSSARDNVAAILGEYQLQSDVRYGTTKVFVRSPKTLFTLESRRDERIPHLVLFLQKVRRCSLANTQHVHLV